MDIVDTEQTPLLGTQQAPPPYSISDAETPRSPWKAIQGSTSALRRRCSQWGPLWFCLLFVLLIDIPSFMSETPKLRMLELSLCREYYSTQDPSVVGDDGSVPEDLCKLPQIHSSLAKQLGLLGIFLLYYKSYFFFVKRLVDPGCYQTVYKPPRTSSHYLVKILQNNS